MRRAFRYAYDLLAQEPAAEEKDVVSSAPSALRSTLKQAFAHLKHSRSFDGSARGGENNSILVGVDEVGRGPLAGPLVAACVAYAPPLPWLPFLRDSKKLRAAERKALAPMIKKTSIGFGYGVVEPEEFGGELNLHHLVFCAMLRALRSAGFKPKETKLLIDGKFALPYSQWPGQQQAIIGGDDLSFTIASASILAKVYRDEVMIKASAGYPDYGFHKNVGYGTLEHRAAILNRGLCPLHRKNFCQSILNTP